MGLKFGELVWRLFNNSKIFCRLLFTALQILKWVDSFNDSFCTVSYSIWSLSFGLFYNHAYISIIDEELKVLNLKH